MSLTAMNGMLWPPWAFTCMYMHTHHYVVMRVALQHKAIQHEQLLVAFVTISDAELVAAAHAGAL